MNASEHGKWAYIQLGPVHPWDECGQHFFDGGWVEKPPDVVGDVPHIPRYLATTYTVGSRGVYENGDNIPDFKLSPAEEEIVVEDIE